MTRDNIMEAMNGIGDHLIVEAAEKLGFLSDTPMARKPKGQSAFSRFMNSGWGVAAVCALVAVSVMGGIIWAGQQAGHQPPAEESTETTELESLVYIGNEQTDIEISCNGQIISPRRFLDWEGYAEDWDFYDSVKYRKLDVYLPVLYYTRYDEIEWTWLNESCRLRRIRAYDMNMQLIETDQSTGLSAFLMDLPEGRYHIALYGESLQNNETVWGADYAFTVNVAPFIPSSEPMAPEAHRFQFPLISAEDTTSYVAVSDMNAEGAKWIEFFVQPDGQDLTSAYKKRLPAQGEMYLLVVACREKRTGMYKLFYIAESTEVKTVDGEEQYTLTLDGRHMIFEKEPYDNGEYAATGWETPSVGIGEMASASYTKETRWEVMDGFHAYYAKSYIEIDNAVHSYAEYASYYDFVVVYSNVTGEEMINTPVETLPVFPFELFQEDSIFKP